MTKMSEYVEIAATEFFAEKGEVEVGAVWIAEFFQEAGVLDDFPNQDVVVFRELVQKALTLKAEFARKMAKAQLDRIGRSERRTK